MEPSEHHDRVSRRLVLWISLILVGGIAVYGVFMVSSFNRSLEPELTRRAGLIGKTVRNDVDRATELGIPLEGLVGVDDYFDVLLEEFPELDYLAIEDAAGSTLYERHSSRIISDSQMGTEGLGSIVHAFNLSEESGIVSVGVDPNFVRSRLLDLALDVVVILIVALVVAFEVTLALNRRLLRRPTGGGTETDTPVTAVGSNTGADIRLVLFFFVVGEELSKSFLPQFIQAAENPIPGVDATIAISLPIVTYLLTLAIAAPFAGRLVSAFGERGVFFIGVAASAASHLGMVFADNVVQIMALRAVTGVGYALATIACLDYLLARESDGSRARTIGTFVAVVIGGTFVGTALGGILADRFGYATVFVVSFVIVVASALLALRMMAPRSYEGSKAESITMADVRTVLRRPALVVLLCGVTIPMNVVLAAFLWYLVPLTMAAIGSSASVIARTLMIYYLVILFGGPAIANLADRHLNRWTLVGLGSAFSAIALVLPAISASVMAIAVAVLAVGLGHTTVRGPQIALAIDIADAADRSGGRGAALAAMRSLERVGSLIGLLIVAVLAARFGLNTAMAAIGVAAALAAVGFLIARPLVAPELAQRAVTPT